MILFNASVTGLDEYTVEQEGSALKLNQNESPFDVPLPVKKEIARRLILTPWHRYPPGKSGELCQAIRRYTGHPEAGILAGNSSNEMIQTIFLAVCRPRDRVVTVSPGFAVFSRMARILDLDLVSVPLREDFSFDVPALLDAASSARLVILATPNNPTGTSIAPDVIEQLSKATSGLLAIDEAYFEFSGETALPFVSRSPNLVVIRTFSKAFSLAALRAGYILGDPDTIRELSKAKMPFSLGILQQIAASSLLARTDLISMQAGRIRRWRDQLFDTLRRLPGVRPIPSLANFILFSASGRPAREVFQALRDQGVLVRVFNDSRLDSWLRVTVGTPKENRAFTAALRSVIREG